MSIAGFPALKISIPPMAANVEPIRILSLDVVTNAAS